MGVDPSVWGPLLWNLLHALCATLYPGHVTYDMAGRTLAQRIRPDEKGGQARGAQGSSTAFAGGDSLPQPLYPLDVDGRECGSCRGVREKGQDDDDDDDDDSYDYNDDLVLVEGKDGDRAMGPETGAGTVAKEARVSARSARQSFVGFLYALHDCLPCGICRHSYRMFVKRSPPERAPDLISWLFELHECVNEKLDRTSLFPFVEVKLRRRLRVWSSHIAPESLWDLLVVFALECPPPSLPPADGPATAAVKLGNDGSGPGIDGGVSGDGARWSEDSDDYDYDDDDDDDDDGGGGYSSDEEERLRAERNRHEVALQREGHVRLLGCLAELLPRVPALASAATYVGRVAALSANVAGPREAYDIVSDERRRWAQGVGLDAPQVEAMMWCEEQMVADAHVLR